MDDDLFNVPDNEDDMMNEEEDELDIQDQVNNYGTEAEADDNDNDEDNEEEEEDEEEDEDEEDDNEDEEDEEDEGKASKDSDDSKFVDAREITPKEGILLDSKDSEDDERSQQQKDIKDGVSDTNQDENGEEAMDVDSTNVDTRETLRMKAKHSFNLDIVPSVAIPYSSQCHAIAFTDGPKWIITGGEDGFIRKYDFIASIQGKSPLTMAQRHTLVDSINKAGVINSYWENEQPLTRNELMKLNPKIKKSDFTSGSISYEPKVNPVYALDVERNGYWCLSGVLSGGISLYTMRYNEGTLHHYFNHGQKKQNSVLNSGHTDAISSLKLNQDQDKFLSGSWDKTIRQWDLNTGKCINLFQGCSGQISQLHYRPEGLSDLILTFDDSDELNDQNSDMGSLFGDSDNEDKNNDTETKEVKKVPINKNVTTKQYKNDSVFMSSQSDGTVNIWDIRTGIAPIIKYKVPSGTPPWCMSSSWSNNGDFIYVGRRNSTVDEFSIKMPHKRSKLNYTPNVLKTLQFPKISGPVTALTTMPNDDYLLCGSSDNIRLYNLSLYNSEKPSNVTKEAKKTQATPFLIVPGHHGGVLSSLYVDDTGRFMVSASGNRGWGNAAFTESVIVYEIDFETKTPM